MKSIMRALTARAFWHHLIVDPNELPFYLNTNLSNEQSRPPF